MATTRKADLGPQHVHLLRRLEQLLQGEIPFAVQHVVPYRLHCVQQGWQALSVT